MRALVVFLLFAGMQLAAGVLAGLLPATEGDVFMGGTHITARNLGLSLLLCEGVLALCLWLWFYVLPKRFSRFSDKEKAPAVSATEAIEVVKVTEAPTNSSMNTGKKTHATLVAMAVTGVTAFALGLSFLVEPLQLSDGGMDASFAAMVNTGYCLLLLCLVGPVAEELVFRAGVLESLRRAGLNGTWSAAVSALSFAVVHGNWAQGIPAFIVGFLLGLLYLRTRNLRLCLPAHIANNVLGVCIMKSSFAEKVNDLPVWGAVTLGVLLMACSVPVLRSVLRGNREHAS